ncbi:MAG: hypothetical protein A3F40_00515 [Chlamydiae bacterium RIFCSPHIGHO2_12_FULL_27_8]|nr:MAG: hypothetical protein A3F40_00515 [Chlamydiae bacterium RIFCSPHIGHO2_12_FULL_27_8]
MLIKQKKKWLLSFILKNIVFVLIAFLFVFLRKISIFFFTGAIIYAIVYTYLSYFFILVKNNTTILNIIILLTILNLIPIQIVKTPSIDLSYNEINIGLYLFLIVMNYSAKVFFLVNSFRLRKELKKSKIINN